MGYGMPLKKLRFGGECPHVPARVLNDLGGQGDKNGSRVRVILSESASQDESKDL